MSAYSLQLEPVTLNANGSLNYWDDHKSLWEWFLLRFEENLRHLRPVVSLLYSYIFSSIPNRSTDLKALLWWLMITSVLTQFQLTCLKENRKCHDCDVTTIFLLHRLSLVCHVPDKGTFKINDVWNSLFFTNCTKNLRLCDPNYSRDFLN